ncbi:hypothetical protein DPMN_039898 [Dreissena polymorpha]|uniref:Uncharacterized protein n=1 Tax=Dreissena polymorpha TaxID=45954 RepID=A0A9D4CUZ4_DREPO|nr:hypothetical protein DPMN_039898 [Dreissena polymorpha]
MSKFHEDWDKNVSSRPFTCCHYIHIKKTPPLPGGHVFSLIMTIFKPKTDSHLFQLTDIIFKLVQDIIRMNLLTNIHEDRTINVASREKGHVFQANATIFELIQDIIETNLLTKFHDHWTINANVDVAQRTTDNGRQTKGDHKSSP